MLLLWIIYVISVLFCYAFMYVCLLMPCGHLLGKGWPLGSRLWCLIVMLSFSHWYPWSGVVLDCINYWFCPLFTLQLHPTNRYARYCCTGSAGMYIQVTLYQCACLFYFLPTCSSGIIATGSADILTHVWLCGTGPTYMSKTKHLCL